MEEAGRVFQTARYLGMKNYDKDEAGGGKQL
jgi:hypothetical protein